MDCSKGKIGYQRIICRGRIQGVGFRPFVFQLANKYKLKGDVKNCMGEVEIRVSGDLENINCFIHELKEMKVPHAFLEAIEVTPMEVFSADRFMIVSSEEERQREEGSHFLLPDLAICDNCKEEIQNAEDRRYEHFFNTCVSCGPRFTIMKKLPYDRIHTTMDHFTMCGHCDEEYKNPSDKRFHAETVSCKACGPELLYRDRDGFVSGEDAFHRAVNALLSGGIIAIKGIGGYHLACSPYDQEAVGQLRQLKGRDAKPFAVMFQSVEEIQKICDVHETEKRALLSNPRPITLLHIKKNSFAGQVLMGRNRCGCFLPYAPLQHLLLEKIPHLVLTSANKSGSPIISNEEEMFAFWQENPELCSGVLYNDREILRNAEDSVVQYVDEGRVQMIRRARGYVPLPVTLDMEAKVPFQEAKVSFLAAGGDLKASFSIVQGKYCTLSPFIGDLENENIYYKYKDTLEDWMCLYHVSDLKFIACDQHPKYFSAALAEKMAAERNIPLFKTAHHHAHIASVMAEHHIAGKVLGIAFDGSGYGEDGAVWGGEFLLCEEEACKRLGHLSYTELLGGDSAAKDARKTAACFLTKYDIAVQTPDKEVIQAALEYHINTFRTSSMGRLFDAVASLLGICHINEDEGQCASMLQLYAEEAVQKGIDPLFMRFEKSEREGTILYDCADIIQKAYSAKEPYSAALGFHCAVADMIEEICHQAREEEKISQIALSGGVFQNQMLLCMVEKQLRKKDFRVYYNTQVPPNDGGISLGQAYIGIRRWHQYVHCGADEINGNKERK